MKLKAIKDIAGGFNTHLIKEGDIFEERDEARAKYLITIGKAEKVDRSYEDLEKKVVRSVGKKKKNGE